MDSVVLSIPSAYLPHLLSSSFKIWPLYMETPASGHESNLSAWAVILFNLFTYQIKIVMVLETSWKYTWPCINVDHTMRVPEDSSSPISVSPSRPTNMFRIHSIWITTTIKRTVTDSGLSTLIVLGRISSRLINCCSAPGARISIQTWTRIAPRKSIIDLHRACQ